MKGNTLRQTVLSTAMLFAAGFAQGGFNDDWAYKASLTFSGYSGAEMLTNFPVLVGMTNFSGFSYSQVAVASGGDLRFVDADGAELNFEIESWNPSGDTFVWVQVPTLTNNAAITAYWGNAAATLPAYATDGSTWSNGYVAVYHFPETSGTCGDSSPQANTLTAKGNTALGSAGKVGLSPRLPDGNNDWLEAADHSSLEGMGQLTLEAWVYDEQNDTYPRAILSKRTSSSSQISFYLYKGSNRTLYFSLGNSGGTGGVGGEFSGTATDANRWYHVAATYDKDLASNRMKIFLDGVYKSARNDASGNVTATTSALYLGILNKDYGNAWKGKLDEVRIANVARSADWLAATHKTIADNAGFADYGDMEPTDVTTPVFAADPAISLNESGDGFVVSAELASGEADLLAVFGPEEPFAYTNLLAQGVEPGVVVSNTLSGLPADRMLSFGVLATNANGHAILRTSSTPFMSGEVSIAGTSDAFEEGFVHGTFTLTRPGTATNLPLTVAYSASGTAVAGENYAALSGTAVFPVGAASVAIDVAPLLDPENTADTTLTLAIEPGLYFIDAPGEASITIQNWDPPAGYNTWVAPSPGNASVAGNWSQGVPTSDDAILLGVFSTADMTWDAGVNGLPDAVASWTQDSGYTGTVTICTMYPEVAGASFTNFTVSGDMAVSGGKITQVANAIQKEEYRLNLSVGGNLTVTAPGLIDVSVKGPRGVMASRAANTYGGDAGTFGKAFGDPKRPYFCGVGNDGNWSAYYKAAGGGAAWIEVGGAVSLSGSIRANGGRFQTTVSGELTSGGNIGTSGGSVYLKAASLSGSGTIQASAIVNGDNMAASGGRIAIELTGTANELPLDNIKAWADAGIAGHCGVGTIVVKNPGQANGTLILRGNSAPTFSYNSTISDITRLTSIPAASEWTFDSILLGDFGQLVVPAGCTLNLPNGFASVTASNLVSNANSLYASGILVCGGTVNAPAVGAMHTIGGGKWTFHPASNFVFDADVVVKDGANLGTLAMASLSNNYNRCWFTVNGNLTVESTGLMRAENGGVGGNGTAQDFGAFIAYPFGKTWGTGHGGQNGMSLLVNNAYGSFFSPTLPGTPGGYHDFRYVGGGAIVGAVSGTLTVDGSVSSGSATSVGRTSWSSRAPAPGSINLTAGSLAGSGTITANGASGKTSVDSNSYGASGGGRIAVRLTGAESTFSDSWKDRILARGYTHASNLTNPTNSASAGSIYLQTAAQPEKGGTIIIRNDGVVGNLAWTPIPSSALGDSAADFKKAALSLAACGKARLFETLQAETLSMESDTVLDVNGKTLVVRTLQTGGENVPSGTYAAGSALFTEGYVTDSAGGGSVVVLGASTLVVIR